MRKQIEKFYQSRSWPINYILLIGLLIIAFAGLFILYSASNSNLIIFKKQVFRLLFAFSLMIILSQIPIHYYKKWTPIFFITTLLLLLLALIIGKVGQGARRWITIGAFQFQPSEIMKLALPMLLSWFLSRKKLPPNMITLAISSIIIIIPMTLVARQPDLGTAIIIGLAGFFVLLLAGIQWKIIIITLSIFILSAPVLWHNLHHYQKERVLTFLNPEHDPLGSGYHIIQSKIAIGSGGIIGKGWLNGTQSHLSFLPAHTTDFIFAVGAEEFGFVGCGLILSLFLAIFLYCFYLSTTKNDGFSRLLLGSLSLTFIASAMINVGMVIGILPVVGVPLPLISYGGSAILVTAISFGIIMSICSNNRFCSN